MSIQYRFPDGRAETIANGEITVDEYLDVICPECLLPAYRVFTTSRSVLFFHHGYVTGEHVGYYHYIPIENMPDPVHDPEFGFDPFYQSPYAEEESYQDWQDWDDNYFADLNDKLDPPDLGD